MSFDFRHGVEQLDRNHFTLDPTQVWSSTLHLKKKSPKFKFCQVQGIGVADLLLGRL